MQKAFKKILFMLGVFSLLLAFLVSFFAAQRILPYRLQLSPQVKAKTVPLERMIFHDLDHDGIAERLSLVNDLLQGFYYVKIYREDKRGLIDQFNFNHPLIFREPFFYDFNHDGVDEFCIFSNDDQALYLSIVDVFKQQYLTFERPILSASLKRSRKNWDVYFVTAQITELHEGGRQQLLFSVNSGYSKLPRCLCLYDFEKQSIVRRFDHHMGPTSFEVADFNRDGKKEIVLASPSTYNFPPDVYLSDAFSWLILLDNQLRPLKPPLKLGGKFSRIKMKATNRKLGPQSVVVLSLAESDRWSLFTVDSLLHFKQKIFAGHASDIYINDSVASPEIYVTMAEPEVLTLDLQLNVLNTKELAADQVMLSIDWLGQAVGDSLTEIIAHNRQNIYLFNQKWELQARYTFPEALSIYDLRLLKHRGQAKPVIRFHTERMKYTMVLLPNPLYGKVPTIFLLVSLLSFSLLLGLFWLMEKIWRYTSSFIYFLKASENAIILIDFKGRVLSVNKKVNRFLNLKKPLAKGMLLKDGLHRQPKILAIVERSRKELVKITEQVSIEEAASNFIGEVSVTPFIGVLGYVYAFLVEIKDSTKQVLFERQQNWQRNVRKLAHDIKTPIAGIQLKLQMLYMQLLEEAPQLTELHQELETIHKELKRIGSITKNFLKVSDLEHLNIKEIEIKSFLEQVLEPFHIYEENSSITIDVDIRQGVPQFVYWDEKQIELLIHILVENAIDAVKKQGKIQIEIRPSAKIKNVKKPWLEIRIQDSGKGIPLEIRHRIFEPHFSTKKEGTGLGLAFAKHIAQQHGGSITFFSDLNIGTVFVVTLPSFIEKTSRNSNV